MYPLRIEHAYREEVGVQSVFLNNHAFVQTAITLKILKSYMGFYTFLTMDDLYFRLFGLEFSTASQTSDISF